MRRFKHDKDYLKAPLALCCFDKKPCTAGLASRLFSLSCITCKKAWVPEIGLGRSGAPISIVGCMCLQVEPKGKGYLCCNGSDGHVNASMPSRQRWLCRACLLLYSTKHILMTNITHRRAILGDKIALLPITSQQLGFVNLWGVSSGNCLRVDQCPSLLSVHTRACSPCLP